MPSCSSWAFKSLQPLWSVTIIMNSSLLNEILYICNLGLFMSLIYTLLASKTFHALWLAPTMGNIYTQILNIGINIFPL